MKSEAKPLKFRGLTGNHAVPHAYADDLFNNPLVSHVERIGRPMHERNPAVSVPFGTVKLELLRNPNWRAELGDVFRIHGRIRQKRSSAVISEETLRNRRDIIFSTIEELMKRNRLVCLAQVRPKYVPVMFQIWRDKKVSNRAQLNYFSAFRWFWRVFGIGLPPIRQYEIERDQFVIQRAARVDLSWSGNGVNIDEVIEAIRKDDPIAARLFLAMRAFGLRAKEALRLEPHSADEGHSLRISKGSKTGRPRTIWYGDFDEMEMHRMIESMRGEVPEGCHLAWENRTLAQAKARLYTICRKHGITRNQLGVTMHGLRHEWAIDALKRMTDVDPPVRGGQAIDYRKLAEARRVISMGLGHARPSIGESYYGSFLQADREQGRRQMASFNILEPLLPRIFGMLGSEVANNLYWIGDRALGKHSNTTVRFEFLIGAAVELTTAVKALAGLANLVTEATGRDARVYTWAMLSASEQEFWAGAAVPLFKPRRPDATGAAADATSEVTP